MKQPRFTEVQIIGILKEQEDESPTAKMCRKHGISLATFYKQALLERHWFGPIGSARFGSLSVSAARPAGCRAACNGGWRLRRADLPRRQGHWRNIRFPQKQLKRSRATWADAEIARNSLKTYLEKLERAGLSRRQWHLDAGTKHKRTTRYLPGFKEDFVLRRCPESGH